VSGLLGAWLAASLLASSPATSGQVEREVERILEQDRYYFCAGDTDYRPDIDDQRWCELAAAYEFRNCPGFERVCGQALEHSSTPLPEGSAEGQSSSDDSEPGRANPGARTEPKPEPETYTLPDLGGFAQVLMWALLIGMVIAVVWAIAKNFVRSDDDNDAPDLGPEPDASESLVAARAQLRRAVETDVQRLLARAEAAAARGEHEAAINDVYAALLRRLEGERLIVVERWRTNGDYIRALRSRPALRDELREVVREVEQVQFGAAPAEAGRYADIRARVLAVVGRATLAVALALGLGAQLACDEPVAPNSDAAALAGLGTGPMDQRAVAELLLAFDIEARHRAETIDQLAQTRGAIVLLGGVDLGEQDWDRLLTWVKSEGGMLVIASGLEFPRNVGVDYTPGDERSDLVHEQLDAYFQDFDYAAPAGRLLDLRNRTLGHTEVLLERPRDQALADVDVWGFGVEDGQTVIDPDEAEAGLYAVRRELGDAGGQIVVLAEEDLFTNAALIVADNGAFVVNLFRSAGVDEVEFINAYTGAGADNPFDSVRKAKLSALFVQILVFLGLLYAAVGIPFARLRDPERRSRRAFAEHVRTLGQRYAQARASRYVACLYAAWALDRLRERLLPGGRGSSLHPLAQAIAGRTGRDEAEVMRILVEANELREPGMEATRGGPGDLELMRALARLLDQTRSGPR
jgi:hypothetical protein